ncbi:Bro-N domain-containing protein, partial [Sulfuricurvum sp.]|uniref:BRO-N domain-containing protein n=1 Tax=Sulfuricurvum sp. TaxID=2025608 RepID=UPI003BB6B8D9
MDEPSLAVFESKQIRRSYDEDTEIWYFSIVDVVAILSESIDPQSYWRKLKERLKKEGNETVTNCHGLKMKANDGKMRLTDVATVEQLLRLIQSIPSPNAEPFKIWLAKVGHERLQDMSDPALSVDRAR